MKVGDRILEKADLQIIIILQIFVEILITLKFLYVNKNELNTISFS